MAELISPDEVTQVPGILNYPSVMNFTDDEQNLCIIDKTCTQYFIYDVKGVLKRSKPLPT